MYLRYIGDRDSNCPLRLHTKLVTLNHWLVTQRMNMRYHALERHAAAVRQLSNGTNGDDLYICMSRVGNNIQTVNSPMCEYIHEYCIIGTAHSNIQTAQSIPSLVGNEPTMH